MLSFITGLFPTHLRCSMLSLCVCLNSMEYIAELVLWRNKHCAKTSANSVVLGFLIC